MTKPSTPAAISRGIDRIKKLREDATAAFMAGRTVTHQTLQQKADELTRDVAAALRASSYWAEDVKASLLRQIEYRAA